MRFLVLLWTGRILLFEVRKYQKTIDVKIAIESVLALFVVEKMSRSSVRDWPPASFFPISFLVAVLVDLFISIYFNQI